MYVCMYVCICTYDLYVCRPTYVCMYVCTYVCTYEHSTNKIQDWCFCVYVYVNLSLYMYAWCSLYIWGHAPIEFAYGMPVRWKGPKVCYGDTLIIKVWLRAWDSPGVFTVVSNVHNPRSRTTHTLQLQKAHGLTTSCWANKLIKYARGLYHMARCQVRWGWQGYRKGTRGYALGLHIWLDKWCWHSFIMSAVLTNRK